MSVYFQFPHFQLRIFTISFLFVKLIGSVSFLSNNFLHKRIILNVYENKNISNRYPSITPRSEFNETKVYSGMLASARFLYGDMTIATVGGTDASLMLWELVEE